MQLYYPGFCTETLVIVLHWLKAWLKAKRHLDSSPSLIWAAGAPALWPAAAPSEASLNPASVFSGRKGRNKCIICTLSTTRRRMSSWSTTYWAPSVSPPSRCRYRGTRWRLCSCTAVLQTEALQDGNAAEKHWQPESRINAKQMIYTRHSRNKQLLVNDSYQCF